MSNLIRDLSIWRDKLQKFAATYNEAPEKLVLDDVWGRATAIGKSSSKSWMGYHANVYYKNFEVPPAGVHFDIEWGFQHNYFSAQNEDWTEYSDEAVSSRLLDDAANNTLAAMSDKAEVGTALFESARKDILSLLSVYLDGNDDTFVQRIKEEIDKAKILGAADIAQSMAPKKQVITRDLLAAQQGTWVPPHAKVLAKISAAQQPAAHCYQLTETLNSHVSHIARTEKRAVRDERFGTNVFIGHGRSIVWRDLKDFIKDRLRLPYDEFNRVPIAGVTNIARLSEMLDAAACAFLIMTAEDEQADGKIHARMNVIHEAGLFQGRLGFTKAIVLLEDGCEEFTNIQGLGQIRFPAGNISAVFEQIRQVLEREGLLEQQSG